MIKLTQKTNRSPELEKEHTHMGLAERRKIRTFNDGLEDAQKELNDFLGFDLPITLELESFPEEPAVISGYEYYKDYGFPQTVEVLKSIGQDDLGKEAIQESIQTVVIRNTSKGTDDGGECSMSLEDKVLLMLWHIGATVITLSDDVE